MRYKNAFLAALALSLIIAPPSARTQTAESLRQVRRLYVGSFGSYAGSTDLRDALIRSLKRKNVFEIATRQTDADAIIEGRGELWIRGYHSLSPRARANADYAEPVYTGYLSVRVRGRNDEVLWSYFADPRRVTVHDVKRDLVDEVATRLRLDHSQEISPPPPVSSSRDRAVTLLGGGSTFASPIYQEWFNTFRHRHPAWTFVFSPLGSGTGITELSAGHLDFAGTDIPPEMLNDEIKRDNNFVPSVGGAVVLIYNVPGFTGDLHLTAEVVAGIFSRTITRWNDSKLKAINTSIALPDAPIQVFHRVNGSGTTFALLDFLKKANTNWAQSIDINSDVHWPTGKGANSNEALAKAVEDSPYSFGYTEFIYAFNHHLNLAAVKNRAGRFVFPDLLSIMAAANWAGDAAQDSRLSIVDSPEPSAYPISTLTWIAVPRSLSTDKKAALSAFLEWMLTAGQRQCSSLGYAPLPRNLLDLQLSLVRRQR